MSTYLCVGLLMSPRPACAAPQDSGAANDETAFDTKVLQARGFSADFAKFFARGARFLPGIHRLKASVNASRPRELLVKFDGEGEPCFDVTLWKQLGLRIPEGLSGDTCLAVDNVHAGARVKLRPGTLEMELTVPEDALELVEPSSMHKHGGAALVLNYDAFMHQFRSRYTSSGYAQMWVESGVNVSNWTLRNRGTFTRNPQGTVYRHQGAYVQRGLEDIGSVLQFGQLFGASEAFGGIPFIGAQLFSDTAQGPLTSLAVPIQGLAESNAVVEVRQYGRLLYRTVVTPGPYSLNHIDGLAAAADIDVRVIEENGRIQQFSLPGPLSSGSQQSPATYQFGFGRYDVRGMPLRSRKPWLAYGGYAMDIANHYRVAGGVLASSRHQAGRGQLSVTSGNSWITAEIGLTRSRHLGLGREWQLQANTRLNSALSAGVSWRARSRNVSVLEDAVYRFSQFTSAPPLQRSLGISLAWSTTRWGAYSYSASGDGRGNVFHFLSAARKFGILDVRLQFQVGGHDRHAAYLNLQMPLGRGDARLQALHRDAGQHSIAATYQHKLNQDVSYQVNAETTRDQGRLGGSMRWDTRYTQLFGSVSATGNASRSLYFSVGGSAVLTGAGQFAMSSSRVGDTFAVVRTPRVSGVRLSSGGGDAKVLPWGSALIPTVYPYRNISIQLVGKSLPLNYRFASTAIDLNLARGTVGTHAFEAAEIRQLLLRIKHADGSPARTGSALVGEQRNLLGSVIGNGNVLLVNDDIGKPAYLENGAERCRVNYEVPTHFDSQKPYEEVLATCT
ncbi:fimbria/pilus outer membrane usher protein [Dyella sp.]|uniref:fimbria/pilus outer membrane usher protein n=1 Tax=Dyella sp. TaxID=1869338 RepID=UPI002ED4BF31